MSVFDLVQYVILLLEHLGGQPLLHLLGIPYRMLTFGCSNKSYTLPFAHRQNVCQLALDKRGKLLLSVDEDGQAILTNIPRRVVLYHFSLPGHVSSLSFSPCSRYFAVGVGRQLQLWSTPDDASDTGELEFAPFVRYRVLTGHFDVIQGVEWSSDSRFLLTSSLDLTARIWSRDPEEGFTPTTLAGHRQGVVGAWFSSDQETIYTIAEDGALFRWEYVAKRGTTTQAEEEEEGDIRWRIVHRHIFHQTSRITSASYHPASNILVTGFANGIFGLYELPDVTELQTLR